MRIILTAFGTTGDNAPFFALAEALRAQGDEPLLLLNPLYQGLAAERGLPYVAVGPRWSPDEVSGAAKYIHPLKGAIAIWHDFYLPNVAHMFAAVQRAIVEHRAELVVNHWLCFGSHFAARQASVPHAIVNLAPCWWYSRSTPSIYSPIDGPDWFLRWLLWLPRALVNHFIGASMKRVCRELGVPYRRDAYFAMFGGARHNLGMWSPSFRPLGADDPAGATLCGFPWDDANRAVRLAPELERFLDEGEPPVVVGLGSSVKVLGSDVYRALGAACVELGHRAVLVGANAEQSAGLPGVLAITAAPYSALFGRARAIVHHGGIGTLAEALRAGRPMAVVPFLGDQFDNARYAAKLGVAHRWSRRDIRGRRLPPALRALIDDEALRRQAASVGERLRGEPNGAVVAARTLRPD